MRVPMPPPQSSLSDALQMLHAMQAQCLTHAGMPCTMRGSTGGILAVALALRDMSLEDCEQIYRHVPPDKVLCTAWQGGTCA